MAAEGSGSRAPYAAKAGCLAALGGLVNEINVARLWQNNEGGSANGGVPLRILHVITRINQGGTARWLDVLVEEQKRAGHEVVILAGEVQSAEDEDEISSALPVVKIPSLGRRISPARDLRSLEALTLQFRRLKPDLINTHTSKAGALGRLANYALGPWRPTLVHTIHGHLLSGFTGTMGTMAIRETERALGGMSDGIICVGPTTHGGIVEAGIGRGRPVAGILPGARNIQLLARGEARSRLGIPKNDYVVTWMGRLTRQKNPQLALDTASLMPETTWVIAGDGDLRSHIQDGALPNVRVVGWSDPGLVLGAADAYVHTADWEGFPYSVVEALQVGLPVVSTASVPPVPGVTVVTKAGTVDAARAISQALEEMAHSPSPNEAEIRERSAPFLPSTFSAAHEALYSAATAHRYGPSGAADLAGFRELHGASGQEPHPAMGTS